MTATSSGCASSTATDRLAAAGERALREAIRLFESDIIDPAAADLADSKRPLHGRAVSDREKIDAILAASGWTWAVPYAGNRRGPEWCGLTAGACWRAAGLDPKWLATYFASTYRMALFFAYRSFDDKHPNPAPPQGAARRLAQNLSRLNAGVDARPGDILVVGDGSPEAGDHITIVESYADGVFKTISGNGGGTGPDGKRREGVVRRDFALAGTGYRAMWLYRPAASDLV